MVEPPSSAHLFDGGLRCRERTTRRRRSVRPERATCWRRCLTGHPDGAVLPRRASANHGRLRTDAETGGGAGLAETPLVSLDMTAPDTPTPLSTARTAFIE